MKKVNGDSDQDRLDKCRHETYEMGQLMTGIPQQFQVSIISVTS